MNFLPQFLNPTVAAIAAALAIPALLILYFLKLRRMTVPVGSTLLWKKAIQDLQVNSPFQKLRRNLLLLLQLLVLLALLLALARPVSEGTAVAGAKTVILIDRSASMNAADGEGGGTRLDEAKRRAGDLVGTMKSGQQAMVIAFADDAQTVQPFTGDAAALRGAIDAITPTDRPTRLKTAYTLANANMQFDFDATEQSEQTAADAFLFSDGRVPASDVAELSLRGRLHYERVGKNETKNLAVVAASARRNYERPTEVQVFGRLANYGPDPVEARVRVSVAEIPEDEAGGGGGGSSRELEFAPVTLQPIPVSLPPARWSDPAWRERNPEAANKADETLRTLRRADSVDVRLELNQSAVLKVELADLNADALPADDAAWVVVPPPEPLRVLLVTDGNYFMERLLDSLQLDDPQTVTPAQYDRTLPTDFDVVVFDNYAPKELPAAGTFVFSGVLPPPEASDVRPVVDAEGFGLIYELNEVLDWERDHPILDGLNLNRVYATEGRLLALPLGADLLIEGTRGPMVVLERKGPRTHVIFSFDLMQSNWQLTRTWPIFVHQMFQYLAAGEDVRVRESVRPGALVAVPRASVDRAGATGGVTLAGPGTNKRVSPDGGGALTLGPFEQTGLYRTSPTLPQFERIAVSLLDETESDLLPNVTDPGNLSGITAAQAAAPEGETAAPRNVEWWWWLVAAAAGVLLVEWAVYTRRVGL